MASIDPSIHLSKYNYQCVSSTWHFKFSFKTKKRGRPRGLVEFNGDICLQKNIKNKDNLADDFKLTRIM
jgi:hypothetical protein